MHLSKLISPLLVSLSLAPSVYAKPMAVLIGVSDYEYIDADLKGPANDVVLMAETLSLRGFSSEDIWILSSPSVTTDYGVLKGNPTRKNIISHIKTAGTLANRGDELIIYYSGHGSSAPDKNGDEAGGQDEILLPSDVRSWNGVSGTVEGAIVDDEWAVLIQPFMDKGVKIIGIVDACHSSTGFRGMPKGVARYIAPETLGIPNIDTENGPSDVTALKGDFVFLYSAQPDERAFEYPHGASNDDSAWHGDFTHALSNALAQPQVISWRDALFVTQNLMKSDGPAPQTPAGEGPLLDSTILGNAPNQRSFTVSGNTIQAGLIHGLQTGAIIEISGKQARITEIQPRTATLTADFDLPKNGIGKVIYYGPSPLPKISKGNLDGFASGISEYFVWSDNDADFYILKNGDNFALNNRNESYEGAVAAGAPTASNFQDLDNLISNAVHLFRIRNTFASLSKETKTGFTLPSSDVKVVLNARKTTDTCKNPSDLTRLQEPIRLLNCDQIWLNIENPSSTPRDVTVLYVNQDRSITPIWPEHGLSNRISLGEAQEIGMQVNNDTDQSILEQLIVIAVPAEDGQLETDLTYLAYAHYGLTRGMSQTQATRWLTANLNLETNERGFGLQPPEIIVSRYTIQIDRR